MRTHRTAFLRSLPAALFVAMLMLVSGAGTQASAQVVTNGIDSGLGTLRDAISGATNNALITFAPNLSGATITLSGTLAINTNLTIDASALPGGIHINGNGSVQIFNASGSTVILNSLTIINGNATNGGGIYNNWNATLMLTNCTLSGNSDSGIYNLGTLTLTKCTLSHNSASVSGGGIDNFEGTVTMNQCTLSDNSALLGGGIYSYGTPTHGTLTMNQCTLSGNSAYSNIPNDPFSDAGGIYNDDGTLTLNQCTVSGNSAVYVNVYSGGDCIFNSGTLLLLNSIVAGNNAGSGVAGVDINNEYEGFPVSETNKGSNLVQNLVGGYSGPAPLTNAPDLAPLGNYGGPTQTMPPLPGSPAIGAGSIASNTFATDQRGFPRTQNGLLDIGAVEQGDTGINPIGYTASLASGFGPLSVQFTSLDVDSLGNPNADWNWNFGDGVLSTNQNPSHIYTSAGVFTPTLFAADNLGIVVPASGPSITVSPWPVLTCVISGSNLVLNGSNGVSGLTYYVLASANPALPLSQWTPLLSNTWSANGNFCLTLTNAVNGSVPQEFYILQVH